MDVDASFGPSHRLHSNRDYSRVFNRQQKAAGRWLVLLLRPRIRPGEPAGAARLGVMVSAKTADTAVRRHQLKRWMREVFRLRLKTALSGHDAVVLFRANPPEESRAELERELLALVPKALSAAPQPERRGPRRGPTPAARR
jgi:ribonuclease P protein component